MKSILTRSFVSATALVASGALLAPDAAAQTSFGEWITTGSVEFYVDSSSGSLLNSGLTPSSPLPTIGSALAAAGASIGTVPVTINLAETYYGTSTGEAFPITLPAHGVSIEPYAAGGFGSLVVDGFGAMTSDVFVFDTYGNDQLPDSMLRGLLILADDSAGGDTTAIRIEPTAAVVPEEGSVEVEIVDCLIYSEADVAIDIVTTDDIAQESVVANNQIFGPWIGEGATTIGVRVTGSGEAIQVPASPVIRTNEIANFTIGVDLRDGGLSHATRMQANAVQASARNLRVDSCAPYVVGNTLAFAFDGGSNAAGMELINVTTMALANNLLWNPQHGGMATDPADVLGSLAAFAPPIDPLRTASFNYDQDDLLTPVGSNNLGPATGPAAPDFLSGNAGMGTAYMDLRLAANSPMRDAGDAGESRADAANAFRFPVVPGTNFSITVRRDHGFALRGVARINGFSADIGADETILTNPAPLFAESETRNAALQRDTASANPLGFFGALVPDSNGDWLTDVEITGTDGDLVILVSGVTFLDALPPAGAPNFALFDNFLVGSNLFPNALTLSSFGSLGTGLNVGSVIVGSGPIAGGSLSLPVSFGAFNPNQVEAEAHLQAIVLRPFQGGDMLQTTNRLTVHMEQ